MLSCRPICARRLDLSNSTIAPIRNNGDRRGVAAVEMAIVLPMVLSLAMLTFDLGSTVSTYLVLSNAARAGADHAATHRMTAASRTAWESKIKTAIQSEMAGYKKFDANQLQTTISTSTNADQSTQVVVDLRYKHSTIVPWPGVPKQMSLHYRVEMRQYQ